MDECYAVSYLKDLVSILILGLMVLAAKIVLIYWPFAVAGLIFWRVESTSRAFSASFSAEKEARPTGE